VYYDYLSIQIKKWKGIILWGTNREKRAENKKVKGA